MLRRNVGDEKRRADREPSDIAASEEVIFGSPFLSRKIETDPEHDGEVDSDDDQVHRFERPVGNRNRSCVQHPGLLRPRPLSQPRLTATTESSATATKGSRLSLLSSRQCPDVGVVKDGDCEVYNRLI